MKAFLHYGMLALIVLLGTQVVAQTKSGVASDSDDDAAANQWSFSLVTSGYLVPHDQSYASPTFTADHRWLHLEARYNYEYQKTGSLWAGYNFSVGDKVVFAFTPMLGAVLGNTTGIAPGLSISLTYKRLELSAQSEYVFNTDDRAASFFYTWDELTYSPTDWFHAGLVAQRTRAYHTDLDVQRGFSVGMTHKKMDFTTYIFNAGWTDPTVVLALSFTF
jgi:hypothetical protein